MLCTERMHVAEPAANPAPGPQVPGTYFDALNRNTKLGKAVASAVDELEHLNDMVGRGGPRQTGSRGEGGRVSAWGGQGEWAPQCQPCSA
jgi:hypothetical protein